MKARFPISGSNLIFLWNETEIPAATRSSYTFQSADEGDWIKVRISFTDDAGNQEVVESFRVGPIHPDPNLSDGTVELIPFSDVDDDSGFEFNGLAGLVQSQRGGPLF